MNTPLAAFGFLRCTIWAIVLAVAVTLLPGCMTGGDLRMIADRMDRLETRTGDALEKHAGGQATVEETKKELEAARDEFKSGLKEVAKNVEERTEAVARSGVTLTESGGIAGVLAGVAGLVVHAMRNRREEKLWGTPAQAQAQLAAVATAGAARAPPA